MLHPCSESEMMAEAQMKVLALVLLPVLGCSLALMTKCDMMHQLKRFIDNLPENPYGLGADHFLARLVCYADQANGLNTSAVRTDGNVTLYGTFQLQNDLLCSDGSSSRNVCGQNCRNFIDDDIKDDIACLFKMLIGLLEQNFNADQEMQQQIQLIFAPSCANALDSGYSCSDFV